MSKKELQDKVLEEYRKGNIVVATFEGLMAMPLAQIINQPADGILYDLNRSEEIVLTFIDDPKWVNDYAVAKTIRVLKDRIDELENPTVPTSRPHDDARPQSLPEVNSISEDK
jgi:hypothetical protein